MIFLDVENRKMYIKPAPLAEMHKPKKTSILNADRNAFKK